MKKPCSNILIRAVMLALVLTAVIAIKSQTVQAAKYNYVNRAYSITAKANESCCVEINWKINKGTVSGYKIFRSESRNSGYTQVGALTYNGTSYKDWSVSTGKVYYYKIMSYIKPSINGGVQVNGYSNPTNAVTVACKIPYMKALVPGQGNRMHVTWNKAAGAEVYCLYKSTNGKNWTKVYTFDTRTAAGKKDPNYTRSYMVYTDSSVKEGITYHYMTKGFVTINGKLVAGAYSTERLNNLHLDVPTVRETSTPKTGTNAITFEAVPRATGYSIWYSTSKDGSYKELYSCTKTETIDSLFRTYTYNHTGLKTGSTFYYKVYSYMLVNGKRVYCSPPQKYGQTCDYTANIPKTYNEKFKRIFGNGTYGYKNAADAKAHMTEISIKVWDINSKKQKYTRTYYLTVNKAVATDVKRMFEDIYAGKDRTPIHDIGCYNWRSNGNSSEHSLGLAIDINPNENYMIQGSTILCGSFWNPSTSPYSIPLKCELVSIMERYGFTRGFWGARKDYMHFSYFGT